MSKKTSFLGLALAVLLGVAGCAKEYTYSPPPTAEGQQCVQQCQGVQGNCHEAQAQRATVARQRCEFDANARQDQCSANAEARYGQCEQTSETEYTACLKYAPDRKTCVRKACTKDICTKDGCYQSADHAFCDTNFRACYQNCGGVVGIMK